MKAPTEFDLAAAICVANARTIYEALRAWRLSCRTPTGPVWEQAPEITKGTMVAMVIALAEDPNLTPMDLYAAYVQESEELGVPIKEKVYADLPPVRRVEYHLMLNITKAIIPLMVPPSVMSRYIESLEIEDE